MKRILIFSVLLFFFAIFSQRASAWGFYGHKTINKMSVFALPGQLIGFYKSHIEYITEHAVDPDKRTFTDPKEGVRHYMDVERYGVVDSIPYSWKAAIEKYTEDTLNAHGLNPWWALLMYNKLVDAFVAKNVDQILSISARLGHYLADACTPLHTTKYYDGKESWQKGIHSFWESRIPELMGSSFDFLVGQAIYIERPVKYIWDNIRASHAAIDTIFIIQEKMNEEFPGDLKYSLQVKGQTTTKVFSEAYTKKFEELMNDMVERRMQQSVRTVSCFWYTAWVNAGQPDLSSLEGQSVSESHNEELIQQEKDFQKNAPEDIKEINKN